MSDARFSGRVVLITGGSSGIGLAAAQLFAAEGARLVLVGRDPGALQAAATKLGGEVLTVAADVGQVADVERVVIDRTVVLDKVNPTLVPRAAAPTASRPRRAAS